MNGYFGNKFIVICFRKFYLGIKKSLFLIGSNPGVKFVLLNRLKMIDFAGSISIRIHWGSTRKKGQTLSETLKSYIFAESLRNIDPIQFNNPHKIPTTQIQNLSAYIPFKLAKIIRFDTMILNQLYV